MSDVSPELLAPEICAKLPAPLADRIHGMFEEFATRGEHTSALETAHLARLWVAEYLHTAPLAASTRSLGSKRTG